MTVSFVDIARSLNTAVMLSPETIDQLQILHSHLLHTDRRF